jgi:formylglycine-generating enzyme required for sulfatase activity
MTGHDTEVERRIAAVIGSDTVRLDELVRVAGLDHTTDLRFGSWLHADLRDADLRGFDFTGADLTGARFDGACIAGAEFYRAKYDLASLQKAVDFENFVRDEYSRNIMRSQGPSDRRLTDLQTFRDSPLCPEMVVIPAGSFWMGAGPKDRGQQADEKPRKLITFRRPFAIGRFAVTNGEYRRFLQAGKLSIHELERLGDALPVVGIDWNGAVEYCAWLNGRAGVNPGTYRLPSESEWEYAGRADADSEYLWGDRPSSEQANYSRPDRPSIGVLPIDAFAPNAWGLYQMFGNVWEWCSDAYLGNLERTPSDGSPCVAESKAERVLRGGSWFSRENTLRSAHRGKPHKGTSESSVGFRVARSLE